MSGICIEVAMRDGAKCVDESFRGMHQLTTILMVLSLHPELPDKAKGFENF